MHLFFDLEYVKKTPGKFRQMELSASNMYLEDSDGKSSTCYALSVTIEMGNSRTKIFQQKIKKDDAMKVLGETAGVEGFFTEFFSLIPRCECKRIFDMCLHDCVDKIYVLDSYADITTAQCWMQNKRCEHTCNVGEVQYVQVCFF